MINNFYYKTEFSAHALVKWCKDNPTTFKYFFYLTKMFHFTGKKPNIIAPIKISHIAILNSMKI